MNLLPPAPYTNPGSIDQTNQAVVLANLTAVAQGRAYQWNHELATDYVNTIFANWNASYQAGRIAWNANPPAPPAGLMVQPSADGWSFSYPQVGPPVCAVPVYTRVPPPQGSLAPGHVHVGVQEPGVADWWTAGADDTVPDGFVTPDPVTADDGATGFFKKRQYFMGGWWQKIG